MISTSDLTGDRVIDGKFVGNIRCRKLTIARTGHVVGNVLCDHLQLGGRIDGIVVCRLPEGNDQGYLHGSLYYEVPPKHVRVSGIVDYNDPPAAVLALVDRVASEPLSEVQKSVVPSTPEKVATDSENRGFDFSSIVDIQSDIDVAADLTTDELIAEAPIDVVTLQDENSDADKTSASETPSFYPTPEKVASILKENVAPKYEPAEPSPAAGKVKLKASFF